MGTVSFLLDKITSSALIRASFEPVNVGSKPNFVPVPSPCLSTISSLSAWLAWITGIAGIAGCSVAVSFLISEDAMFALIRGPGSPWEVQLTASTAEVGGMFVCPLLDPFRLWMTLKWVKLRMKVTQLLQVTTLPAIALRVARARAKARARCIIASWDFHAKTWGTIWIRLQCFLYFICTLAMCKDSWSWKAWCFPVQGPMECWQCGGGVYYHF